jgi:hypothetical protein
MKRISLILSFVITTSVLFASNPEGDTAWKSKYEVSVSLSQTTFSNWAAGGENAFTANGMLNIFKDYAKGKVAWNNYFGVAYGLSRLEKATPQLRKVNDKINLVSKAGINAWGKWDYAALFEFRSQFDKGYNYPDADNYISKFLAPGYFQFSLGMNYKPVPYFSVFVSPIGARLTLVNDTKLTNREEGAYGIFNGNTTLWQVGGSVNAVFKKDIMKNVNWMSKLDLFSDYRNEPQKIIVGWENNFLMKVNKYISVSLETMLIRDHNILFVKSNGDKEARFQFRETFGVGLAYSFATK